jgi:antitoxin VapB
MLSTSVGSCLRERAALIHRSASPGPLGSDLAEEPYGCYILLVDDKAILAMATAKLFWSGRSQAVRLPKDFRLPGREVRIRRHGSSVILEAVADDWSWLDAIAGKLDDDFVDAVKERPGQQKRPEVDEFFR